MNIDNLKTFIALCDTKSFSLTAGKMYITQSAVSKRIQELEHETGKQLVLRTRSGIGLTVEGEILERYARNIVQLEAKALNQLSAGARFSEILHIGTTYAFYQMYLADILTEFVEQYSDVSLSLYIGHSGEVLKRLLDGSLELAFSHHALHYPGYENRLYSEDELALFSTDDTVGESEGITLSELLDRKYLDTNFLYIEDEKKLLTSPGYPRVKIEIAEYALPLFAQGCYYAIFPRRMLQKAIQQGRLNGNAVRELQLLDMALPPVKHYLVTRREHSIKAVTALLARLESRALSPGAEDISS